MKELNLSNRQQMPFTEGAEGAAMDGRDCGGDRRGRGGIPTQASAQSRPSFE